MYSGQITDLRASGWRVGFYLLLEELCSPVLELLPFFAGSFFRWLFLKLVARRVGTHLFIANHTSIRHCYNLTMGHHLGINQGCIIQCRGGVTIGNYVLIGPRVIINTAGHHCEDADRTVWEQGTFYRPVTIGNDVFIGMGAIIMPGVTIADGTVVGAGAVVTADTEPYSVVAGVPARIIKRRHGLDETPASACSSVG